MDFGREAGDRQPSDERGAAINFFRWASERIHRKFHLVVGAVKNTRRNLPIRISSWLVSTAESTG